MFISGARLIRESDSIQRTRVPIFFFSREETRIHIHIQGAKFWLEPEIELAENYGLRSGELSIILELIEEHQDEIRNTWINTWELEVTSITREGVWLSLQGRELCLTFEDFPWFRDATVAAIMNVQLTHPDHLYWPDLDVDLAVESVVYPERFPLVAK